MDWHGLRVLISGGSGFIGTNAVEYFTARGATVRSLDYRPPQNPAHGSLWEACDLLDHGRLSRMVQGFNPDYLIHLAARTDLRETRHLSGYAANFLGTEHLIDVCCGCGRLRRVLFASSRMVCQIGYVPRDERDYGPPNLYGESKVRMEEVIRSAQAPFEWIIVRPTSIWGPWFDVPYKLFFTAIENRTYVHPVGRDPEKSFGFVGNTVYQYDALLRAPREEIQGATLYQCDYPPLRLREWAELIRLAMHLPPIRSAPLSLLRMAARAGDLAVSLGWSRVPLTTFRLNNLLTPMVYDTRRLAAMCGRLPFNLLEGVAMTVEWMRQR